MAIRSFGDRRTRQMFEGVAVRRIALDLQARVLTRLDLIDRAEKLDDLRRPPSNRLQKKKGDLKGYHSIRVNDQWRIIFRWTDNGAEDVTFVDYH